MVQLHTGVHMFVGFWMQHFQTGGVGEMVRHPGHHNRRISSPLTSFYGGMLRTKCFAKITEDMLENTRREIDYRFYVLRATKEHMLKCTNVS